MIDPKQTKEESWDKVIDSTKSKDVWRCEKCKKGDYLIWATVRENNYYNKYFKCDFCGDIKSKEGRK